MSILFAGVSFPSATKETTILFSWAMENTEFRRWVLPSPYFPFITILFDTPPADSAISADPLSMISFLEEEKNLPTARDGTPDLRASIICRFSKSVIFLPPSAEEYIDWSTEVSRHFHTCFPSRWLQPPSPSLRGLRSFHF